MSGNARALQPGEAVPLQALGAGSTLQIGLSAVGGAAVPDLIAVLIDANGRARGDSDLVFYNNDSSADGAVRFVGARDGGDWISVRPEQVEPDVDRVVFGCSGGLLDGSVAGELTLAVDDESGQELAEATFPADAAFQAMIMLEVYRRPGGWRCRLLAQGYAGGLAALVTDFGISVDEEPPPAAAAPPVPTDLPGVQHPAPLRRASFAPLNKISAPDRLP
jgi:tellurite resistance protein TerA